MAPEAHNGLVAHVTYCSRVAGNPSLLLMDEASQAGRGVAVNAGSLSAPDGTEPLLMLICVFPAVTG